MAIVNLYEREPVQPITQELLFSEAGYYSVAECNPQPNNAGFDFSGTFWTTAVAAGGTYFGTELVKALIHWARKN
jgi:hypothetical protein